MTRLTLGVLLAALLAVAARAELEFREVARSGDTVFGLPAPIASFGHWVAINDYGQVAFKVTLTNSHQAIVRATPNADGEYDLSDPGLCHIVDEGDGTSVQLSDYVAINSRVVGGLPAGEVSYRRRMSGPLVSFSIRRDDTRIAFGTSDDPYNWYFRALMQQTDVNDLGMVSFCGTIQQGTQSPWQIRKGDGSQGDHVSHTTLIATQPEFSSFNYFTSINNANMVVFTGSHPTEGTGIFMGDGGPTTAVATTVGGFSATGTSPTINNLNHVGFYGDCAAGEGIYVWAAGTPTLTIPIGDPVSSFAPGARVMINDSDCPVFVGTTEGDTGPVEALFRFTGDEPEVLVKIGDEINGAAPIDDIEFWEGLNNGNQAVFWAHHDDPNGPFESLVVVEGEAEPLPGRVVFADAFATPIANAVVWAYRLVGDNQDEIERLGPSELTDHEGRFERPQAFTDPQYDDDRLGLLAEIAYFDPGSDSYHFIVNYPNNDPFPEEDQLDGTETVRVPIPIVLQGGFWGGTSTWNDFAHYLRLDSGASAGLSYPKFAGTLKLPAYITFAMPNHDQQAIWGYDNELPGSYQPYDENIARLNYFASVLVRDALDYLIVDDGLRARLAINLCGHSMGGTITRGWLHDIRPPVKRYVSFDGVHGGTIWAKVGWARGFAEWYMNGINPEENMPPDPNNPRSSRWNYLHAVSTNRNNLLLSAIFCPVVQPNSSAFGLGRTMRGRWGGPNGHVGRFVGGLEWGRDLGHSEIKSDPETIYHVTRFLAHGCPPAGSSLSGDSGCGLDNDWVRYPQQILGEYVAKFTAETQQLAEAPVYIDGNPSVVVAVMIEGVGAGFDLLDPDGESLVPGDAEVIDLEGGVFITFSVDNPPVGLCMLHLAAGDEAATAYVTVTFDNERSLSIDVPSEPVVPQTPVTITGNLQDGDGNVIVGSGGTIEATIALPDESEQSLDLHDDGSHGDGDPSDGVFGNTFTATDLGGRYLVDAHCQINLNDELVERTAINMFVVNSSPASFLGVTAERPVDETGDGKYDRLEFDIDILLDEPGDYQVRAILQDSNQEMIAEDHVVFEIEPGTTEYTATPQVDAGTLVVHGVPGPWTLTEIQLFDNDQALLVDALDDWITAAYDLSDFASPPAPVGVWVLPDYGPVRGGNEVVLQGGNLEHVSAIMVGGSDVEEFEVWSDSSIRVVMPRAQDLSGGAVDVELTTPWTSVTFAGIYRYVPCPGDLDLDGDIDLSDLAQLLANYGTTSGMSYEDGDLDGDGDVDLSDLAALLAVYGTSCG
jgi:pimeloyl-ACP methyl ester carboxylesterase